MIFILALGSLVLWFTWFSFFLVVALGLGWLLECFGGFDCCLDVIGFVFVCLLFVALLLWVVG